MTLERRDTLAICLIGVLLPTTFLAAAETRSSDPTVPAAGSVRFDPAAPAQLDVVRAKTGHLLVRPVINGRPAGAFIFDTGAGICVISTPFVERFALEPSGSVDAVGVAGKKASAVYQADSLQLGPATFRNHPLMATDLSFLEQYVGEPVVGIIGYGALSQVVARVDLAGAQISLHDPATFQLARGTWTPMVLDDRVPALSARFEGHEGLFKLDIGSNSALVLYEPAVRRWNLLDGRETTETKTGGVGGFVAARRGTIGSIEFGGRKVEQVATIFVTEGKGSTASSERIGFIGVPLLAASELVLDYRGLRIAFVERIER